MKAQKIIWKKFKRNKTFSEYNGYIGRNFYVGTIHVHHKRDALFIIPYNPNLTRYGKTKWCKSFEEAKEHAQKIVDRLWKSITEIPRRND